MSSNSAIRKTLAAIMIAASGGLLFGPPALADSSAATMRGHISTSDEAKVRNQLLKYGVGAVDRDKVISKLRAGDELDSSVGADAISRDEMDVDGRRVSVQRFSDGSFIALPIQTRSAAHDPLTASAVEVEAYSLGPGITGCESLTSVGTAPYVNCTVSYAGPLYTGSFSADVTLSNKVRASIQRVWNENATVVAGTFGNTPTVSITNAREGVSPAEARLSFTWGSAGAVTGSTGSIRLVAAGTAATVESP